MEWTNEVQEDWTVEAVVKHLSHEQLVDEVTYLRAENERLLRALNYEINEGRKLFVSREQLLDALEEVYRDGRYGAEIADLLRKFGRATDGD